MEGNLIALPNALPSATFEVWSSHKTLTGKSCPHLGTAKRATAKVVAERRSLAMTGRTGHAEGSDLVGGAYQAAERGGLPEQSGPGDTGGLSRMYWRILSATRSVGEASPASQRAQAPPLTLAARCTTVDG